MKEVGISTLNSFKSFRNAFTYEDNYKNVIKKFKLKKFNSVANFCIKKPTAN